MYLYIRFSGSYSIPDFLLRNGVQALKKFGDDVLRAYYHRNMLKLRHTNTHSI